MLFKKKSLFIYCVLCVAIFYSCKDDTKLLWGPEMAIPVVNAEFSLKDIIVKSESNINEDSNGFLTLIYDDTLFSRRADQLVQISNQQFAFNQGLDATQIALLQALNTTPPNNTITTPEVPFVFELQSSTGFELDSVLVKSGLFNFILSSDYKQNVQLRLRIPSMVKDGVAFDENFNLDYLDTLPVLSNTNKILDGYRMGVNDNGTPNSLKMFFSFKITKTDNSNTETTQDSIKIKINISDLKFAKIKGRITENLVFIPKPDTVNLSIFENAISGGFRIKNPELGLKITNSFGFSASANMEIFNAFHPITNPTPIAITGAPSPFTITEPSQEGLSTINTILLNSSNSNISDVFFSSPSRLAYKIGTTLNNSPQGNFILDSSRIKVGLKVTLPLEGYISNFGFRDTFPLEFGRTDRIEYFNFKVNVANGFPMETKLQAYFVTENFVLRDSLVKTEADKIIIKAAPVDGNGKVTVLENKMSDLIVRENVVGNLSDVTKVIIVAQANTSNSGTTPPTNVKFYSSYKLNVRFGIKAKLKWKISRKQ
jgi:hypothetical protein